MAFEDRKNAEPMNYRPGYLGVPEVKVDDYMSPSDLYEPSFPDLPSYYFTGYEAVQRYHVELWCEKTTINDILLPLCESYGAVLQTGAGELSITATAALAKRIASCGKPTRIFYLSDFDPAGQSMPVAIARKLEYFVRNTGIEGDIRLFPLVLTAEQVEAYNLPRTPIKPSERRKAAFERQHGEDAVELDALEALRPGELQRLVREAIERYYDTDLNYQTQQQRMQIEQDLFQLSQDVLDRYAAEIDTVRAELAKIVADLRPRMDAYREHLYDLWQAIRSDLQERCPDPADYPRPSGKVAQEDEGLYNSTRDYLHQLAVYKRFQGKE